MSDEKERKDNNDFIWLEIRQEAEFDAKSEPILAIL